MKGRGAGRVTAERNEQQVKSTGSESKRSRKRPRNSCNEEFNFPVQPRTVHVVKKPWTTVNHSYRDFSCCVPSLLADKAPTAVKEMSFSQKLHLILSTKEYMFCIGWMPHGRAFRVHIPKRFEAKVSPKYFGHSRYSSFLRQLNNFGFKHITQGPDRNCYYHECFLRGLPLLCKYMPKPKIARRLISDPENEPNFYRISETFPLPDQSTVHVPIEAFRSEEQEDSQPEAANSSSVILEPAAPPTAHPSANHGRLETSHPSHFRFLDQNSQIPESELLRSDYFRRGSLSVLVDPYTSMVVSNLSTLTASLPFLPSTQALHQHHAAAQFAALENNAIIMTAASSLNSGTSLDLPCTSLYGLRPVVLSTTWLAPGSHGSTRGDLPSKYLKDNNKTNKSFWRF